MPIIPASNNNSIIQILQLAEKARRGGGSGKGPGSRGGKFYRDSKGNIVYGAPPKGGHVGSGSTSSTGTRAVATGRGGGSGKPRVGELRPGYRIKPTIAAGKRTQQRKMLAEMDRAIKSGKDPHGNALSKANLDKLSFLATSLRTDLRSTSKKEIAQEITEKAADRLPFTVFKDKQGKWRWIGISSSAAQDADGETVSLKALQEDTALKDTAGGHGPLNWWHSHIKLGTCDFNAMDGPLLVESGTFVNDTVAVAVEKAIREGVLQPGMSLEFEHNEPGPPVLPGRVFTKINKIGRALLPAEKASNLLTSFKVYSLKNAALADEKGSKKMLTEEKQKKALEFLTPELLEALASDNQVAVKMAESLNLSFKAVADALAPAPAGPVETVTLPATAQTVAATVELPFKVEPPVVAQTVPAPVVEPPAAVMEEPEIEGGGEALDTDALFENLANSVAGKVFAMQQAAQATATKEVNDVMAANTIAMKEVTTALNTVVAENKSLKARLDALDGIQPPAVRARASQSGGVPLEGLPAHVQELVQSDKEGQSKDPYLNSAAALTGQPIHPGLMVSPARMGGQ